MSLKSEPKLKIDDADKIVSPCSKYYGSIQAQQAIQALKQWYLQQEFDDDDFTNDWIPNDYINCDGIHIFMNKLSVGELVNSDANKQILFQWFCYWLYSDLPKPDKQPLSSLNNHQLTEIEEISSKFKQFLHRRISIFNDQHKRNQIGNYYAQICNNNQVRVFNIKIH